MSQEYESPAENAPVVSPPTVEAAVPQHRSHLLREVVETVLLTVVIFLLVNAATGRFRIEGASMEPNLHDSEYVLIDKVSYRLHAPERGDVIVFERQGNERDYIKRVIGLPGDTVQVSGGQVLINGRALGEPYLNTTMLNDMPNFTGVSEMPFFSIGFAWL